PSRRCPSPDVRVAEARDRANPGSPAARPSTGTGFAAQSPTHAASRWRWCAESEDRACPERGPRVSSCLPWLSTREHARAVVDKQGVAGCAGPGRAGVVENLDADLRPAFDVASDLTRSSA